MADLSPRPWPRDVTNLRDLLDRLLERYPDSLEFNEEFWHPFIKQVRKYARSGPKFDHELRDQALQILTTARVEELAIHHHPPCVFISHRMTDTHLAERAACLATEHGYDYWLDIHDPTLQMINMVQGRIPPTVFALLVAGVIEVALLHCSHVLALWSAQAQGSTWLPYEFGRVKARNILDTHACSWVSSAVPYIPEYFYLAAMTQTEAEIRNWFRTPRRSKPCDRATRAARLDYH